MALAKNWNHGPPTIGFIGPGGNGTTSLLSHLLYLLGAFDRRFVEKMMFEQRNFFSFVNLVENPRRSPNGEKCCKFWKSGSLGYVFVEIPGNLSRFMKEIIAGLQMVCLLS